MSNNKHPGLCSDEASGEKFGTKSTLELWGNSDGSHFSGHNAPDVTVKSKEVASTDLSALAKLMGQATAKHYHQHRFGGLGRLQLVKTLVER